MSIANGATTRLVFEAKVTGAKPVLAKTNDYGAGTPGRLELTLSLEQPAAPRAPSPPTATGYGRDWRDPKTGGMKPRPADVARKPSETDDDYATRDAVSKRRYEQQGWDREEAELSRTIVRYTAEKAEYDRASAAHQGRLMSYAQLVGIVSVFGNTPVRVEITPLDQDMLPGFMVGLLSEPVEGE